MNRYRSRLRPAASRGGYAVAVFVMNRYRSRLRPAASRGGYAVAVFVMNRYRSRLRPAASRGGYAVAVFVMNRYRSRLRPAASRGGYAIAVFVMNRYRSRLRRHGNKTDWRISRITKQVTPPAASRLEGCRLSGRGPRRARFEARSRIPGAGLPLQRVCACLHRRSAGFPRWSRSA